MRLELFVNFNGNCREAAAFYAKVFKSKVGDVLTYGEAPPDSDYPLPECDREKVCYCSVKIGGMAVMFMDMPSGSVFVEGNNINPTLNIDNKEEVARVFNELKDGGEVYAELQQTFYSELYGMVKDKFGVVWHIMYYSEG